MNTGEALQTKGTNLYKMAQTQNQRNSIVAAMTPQQKKNYYAAICSPNGKNAVLNADGSLS